MFTHFTLQERVIRKLFKDIETFDSRIHWVDESFKLAEPWKSIDLAIARRTSKSGYFTRIGILGFVSDSILILLTEEFETMST